MLMRNLVILTSLFLAAVAHAADAPAADLVFPGHTIGDIRAHWQTARPTHQGNAATAAPSTAPPYAAGTLAPAFLDDGLRTLNFIRYLAGLPDDLALDPAANDETQHGAVLLAKLGYITHAPTQPADMPDDFYKIARAACASSSTSRGGTTLDDAVRQWTADYGNLPNLGHRRWVLYPPMQRTGFGFCQGYALMKAFGLPERSRSATVSLAAIPWPSAGLFPIQMWDPGETWSVSLDPTRCKLSGQETVTLKRLSDGRVWTLTRADQAPMKAYLAASTAPFGWPQSLAFRIPAAEVHVTPGEAYQVEVQGVQSPDGKPLAISWRTEFCSLGAALTGARLERAPDAPEGKAALTFAFTSDMPTASISWRLFWLLGDLSGRYYTLGSGDTGALPAGEHKVPLAVNLASPTEKTGAVFELDYTVKDQYGAFAYHVSLPVE